MNFIAKRVIEIECEESDNDEDTDIDEYSDIDEDTDIEEDIDFEEDADIDEDTDMEEDTDIDEDIDIDEGINEFHRAQWERYHEEMEELYEAERDGICERGWFEREYF